MLKIGITGGIGSGKSTIAKAYNSLGIPVYDADSRAKWLMSHNEKLRSKIIENFGEESYLQNGDLNRTFLAQSIFSSPENTKRINALVHPAVESDFKIWLEQQKSKYIIKEAALMIESGSYKELDKLVLVKAKEDVRISRIQKRDPHRSIEQITQIIARQLSEDEMLQYADYIIDNNGNEPVLKQILHLHNKFIS